MARLRRGDRAQSIARPAKEATITLWRKSADEPAPNETGWYTDFVPPYTTNLSAAVALCERFLPDGSWILAKGRTRPSEPLGAARIYRDIAGKEFAALEEAATPTLALVLAILSAKEGNRHE